tara:strand:- start:232 stop:1377 length:1146 start_codon:yes stop_codon:yes gene_type:complete
MQDKKVLVAMSGGVDSAVAAALLQKQGYEVIGITLRLYTPEITTGLKSTRNCCGIEEVADAKQAATKLNIPHYVINMEKEFEEKVINFFAEEYANGRTPNPCLNCNRHIKFDTLLKQANAMGIKYLATGHYATIKTVQNNKRLYAAKDITKDQSYVLYTLNQSQLQSILFPLGEIPKTDTRKIAQELGFNVADKPDSVDICFVTSNNYKDFLKKQGVDFKKGNVIDENGIIIGTHDGIPSYTIGQRRGINYTNQKKENPKYINELDLTTNTISVGNKEHLEVNKILLKDINWINGIPSADEKFYCRVRYNGQAEQCKVSTASNETNIILDANIIRPSNGQSCVIYNGDPQQEGEVIGGGIIEKCSYINNAVPVQKSMKEYE